MRHRLSGALAWLLATLFLAGPVLAASSPALAPSGRVAAVAVSDVSTAHALPSTDGTTCIRNYGSWNAYVAFGGSSVTVTATTGSTVPAGWEECLASGNATYIAAIADSGVSTLLDITVGAGIKALTGGGGSSSSSFTGCTANAVAPTIAEAQTGVPCSVTTKNEQRVIISSGGVDVDMTSIPHVISDSTSVVTPIAGTTGGASSYTFEVAASDNHQVVKNGAGTVYDLDTFSIHTAAMFMRLYDAGTGFNGCNSATNLLWEGQIPGASTGAGFIKSIAVGRAFTNGLSVCVTGAFGNTNTSSATASVASVNIGYK